MNAQRKNIVDRSNIYEIALMRELGFTSPVTMGKLDVDLVKAEVVEYIKSVEVPLVF